jgi:hypothetical protein
MTMLPYVSLWRSGLSSCCFTSALLESVHLVVTANQRFQLAVAAMQCYFGCLTEAVRDPEAARCPTGLVPV